MIKTCCTKSFSRRIFGHKIIGHLMFRHTICLAAKYFCPKMLDQECRHNMCPQKFAKSISGRKCLVKIYKYQNVFPQFFRHR